MLINQVILDDFKKQYCEEIGSDCITGLLDEMIIERDDYSGVVITNSTVAEYSIVEDEIFTGDVISKKHRDIIMSHYNN